MTEETPASKDNIYKDIEQAKPKHPGGRPTKYTPELIEKAKHYAKEYYKEGDEIPSNIGLAIVLGIRRSTVYEWGNDPKKGEFSDILDEIQAKQHQVLMNKGLSGDFNSAICKLALGKHGYHDKQDIEHGGDVTHKHEGISRSLELLGEFKGSGSDKPVADAVQD